MNIFKKPYKIRLCLLRGKRSGFALPITILIVMVLIVAGGAGYYLYKTSVEKAEPPVAEEKIEEEKEIVAPVEEEIPKEEVVPEEIVPEEIKKVPKEEVPKIEEKTEKEPVRIPAYSTYCGNKICETGETYFTCPQDCPRTAKEILAFKALVQKIGKDDAEYIARLFDYSDFTLTEEFINEFIIDYSPGYDADEDITIIGGPEAPHFLEIAKASLDRLRNNSPEIYQYSIEALRNIRGVNYGTGCVAAGVEGEGMSVNTYTYIYDYKDVPLDKQPLVYGFLFVHEATHIKAGKLEQSGQIRTLTGIESEVIAFLAHGYYAKEYDPTGQMILAPPPYPNISIKEFVRGWTASHPSVSEIPEDYIWDWDFYVTVLEKDGFPSEDLDKLRAYLSSAD